MVTALLIVLAAGPKADSRLVGNWQLNGQPFLTLNANGSGVMEGDPLKWRTDGATLVLIDPDGESDRAAYQLQGETLTLNMAGASVQLVRGKQAVAKASRLARAAERGADESDEEGLEKARQWLAQQQGQQGQRPPPAGQQPAAPRAAGADQLSRLLLSSNWCWLRYSNGNSYTQKVHFSADGTWQDFSESDIYNANASTQTTVQATGNRSGGGQWAVKGDQLWLSSPEAPQLQPIPLSITRNSNGYPIINADGREYSMCN